MDQHSRHTHTANTHTADTHTQWTHTQKTHTTIALAHGPSAPPGNGGNHVGGFSSEKGSWLCSEHNPEHRRSSKHIDAFGHSGVLVGLGCLAGALAVWALVCFLLASLVCGLVPWPSSLLG